MYTSIAVLSLVTAAVVAQTPTTGTNPLVPTDVSTTCASFLNDFNKGTDLSSCTNAITGATKAFAPGNNASSSDTASALSNLCSSSTASACSSAAVRSQLAKFWTACSPEIKAKNDGVLPIYDVLFTLLPLKDVLCATDDNGGYCVTAAAKNAKSIPSNLKDKISYNPGIKREVAITPNTTTIGASNLLFLFLSPSTSADVLCSTCTRKVFAAYTNFEGDTQYGPGIDNSPTLYGQSPLYDAINSNCGPNFLAGSVQAAGSLSGGLGSGDNSNAAFTTIADVKTAFAVALGIVTALALFH